MKKTGILILLALLFYSVNLWAYGLGGYISIGTGVTTIHKGISSESYDADLGAGFVFDNNLSNESFFNYRLKIGYGVNVDWEPIFHQVQVENLFGFAPIHEKSVRYFMGPLVGVDYLYNDDYTSHTMDIIRVDVGLIPIGININHSNNYTTSIEIGGKYSWLFGQRRDDFSALDLKAIKGNSLEGFIRFAFMWRNE